MSTRAVTVTKRCPMSDDACAARVIEHVARLCPGVDASALVEQACGRYVRGKNKGKLRGWASVELCTSGGWKRTGYEQGRVVYPGAILSVRITDFDGNAYLEAAA